MREGEPAAGEDQELCVRAERPQEAAPGFLLPHIQPTSPPPPNKADWPRHRSMDKLQTHLPPPHPCCIPACCPRRQTPSTAGTSPQLFFTIKTFSFECYQTWSQSHSANQVPNP